MITGIDKSPPNDDRRIWKADHKGQPSALSAYRFLGGFLDVSVYLFRHCKDRRSGDLLTEGKDLTKTSCGLLSTLIAYCLWLIWKDRNESTFNEVRTTPFSIICKALAFMSCCKSILQSEGCL